MPADKKVPERFLDNGAKNEQKRTAALLRKIRTEMKTMSPKELACLYAVLAFMVKKNS